VPQGAVFAIYGSANSIAPTPSENDSSPAEPKNDSGTISEVILPVACTVHEFRQEVFRLNGPNREVFGDFEFNASAQGHREGVQGRVVDAPGSTEQHLRKRRQLPVPSQINPRPQQVGENSRAEAIAGVVATQVAGQPEPMIDIVRELASASVEVVLSTAFT
jgi:hypothetical protein